MMFSDDALTRLESVLDEFRDVLKQLRDEEAALQEQQDGAEDRGEMSQSNRSKDHAISLRDSLAAAGFNFEGGH